MFIPTKLSWFLHLFAVYVLLLLKKMFGNNNFLEVSNGNTFFTYSFTFLPINHIIPGQEADLVTTHELGHNFGAEHDPDNLLNCAPSDDEGGKFVMYPIAVSGDHVNNKVCLSISWATTATFSPATNQVITVH